MKFGLPTILTLIFIILKLCKVIAWSWWLVFLPSILGIAIALLAFVFITFVVLKA